MQSIFFSENRIANPMLYALRLSAYEALLAQWLERAAVNRKVTGSIPVRSAFTTVELRAVVSYIFNKNIGGENGEPGHRSQCLSHAKRALYHLS
jgi:hypothetical protein